MQQDHLTGHHHHPRPSQDRSHPSYDPRISIYNKYLYDSKDLESSDPRKRQLARKASKLRLMGANSTADPPSTGETKKKAGPSTDAPSATRESGTWDTLGMGMLRSDSEDDSEDSDEDAQSAARKNKQAPAPTKKSRLSKARWSRMPSMPKLEKHESWTAKAAAVGQRPPDNASQNPPSLKLAGLKSLREQQEVGQEESRLGGPPSPAFDMVVDEQKEERVSMYDADQQGSAITFGKKWNRNELIPPPAGSGGLSAVPASASLSSLPSSASVSSDNGKNRPVSPRTALTAELGLITPAASEQRGPSLQAPQRTPPALLPGGRPGAPADGAQDYFTPRRSPSPQNGPRDRANGNADSIASTRSSPNMRPMLVPPAPAAQHAPQRTDPGKHNNGGQHPRRGLVPGPGGPVPPATPRGVPLSPASFPRTPTSPLPAYPGTPTPTHGQFAQQHQQGRPPMPHPGGPGGPGFMGPPRQGPKLGPGAPGGDAPRYQNNRPGNLQLPMPSRAAPAAAMLFPRGSATSATSPEMVPILHSQGPPKRQSMFRRSMMWLKGAASPSTSRAPPTSGPVTALSEDEKFNAAATSRKSRYLGAGGDGNEWDSHGAGAVFWRRFSMAQHKAERDVGLRQGSESWLRKTAMGTRRIRLLAVGSALAIIALVVVLLVWHERSTSPSNDQGRPHVVGAGNFGDPKAMGSSSSFSRPISTGRALAADMTARDGDAVKDVLLALAPAPPGATPPVSRPRSFGQAPSRMPARSPAMGMDDVDDALPVDDARFVEDHANADLVAGRGSCIKAAHRGLAARRALI